MITRAQIQYFRSLRDVDLTFEPLTILVGPNASGKSALIAALQGTDLTERSNIWRNQTGTAVGSVSVEYNGSALTPRQNLRYYFQLLHLDLQVMRGANQLSPQPILNESGSNLTNVFYTLTRSQQSDLVTRLVELVPMYRDVVARATSGGYHQLMFQDRWEPSLWYGPHQVSDGTILLLAFLLVQYQSEPVDVLAIEEPERGLHPYLLGELIRMLRQLAMGKLGPHAIQVILATHSAELLEFAEPNEVRFVSRRATDGSTQVEAAPTGSEDWANAMKEYQGSLGGLWLSGSLGGVPGG